jgi:CARDB
VTKKQDESDASRMPPNVVESLRNTSRALEKRDRKAQLPAMIGGSVMPRSAPLLAVAAAAALALPPSASLAQQRGPSRIPPGGPIIPSGRVLAGELPDLQITSLATSPITCIRPFIGQVTIQVNVKNFGKGPAIMPATLPTLGRSWVGVRDLSTFPGVMSIAAGPPAQLLPQATRTFNVAVVIQQGANQSGVAFGVSAKVDPQNFIFESVETNNERAGIFTFPISKLCQ